jgi:1,4-dihydroxy-2-naphthoyl-CoA hydrolase
MTLDEALGFDLVSLEAETAYGRVQVDDRHLQPQGVVHGGVYAALAESVTSHATANAVHEHGLVALGMSNDTSFLRPVSSGLVHARAELLHRGRTTWVWHVRLTDDEGRLCAVSRLTVSVRPGPS